MPRDERGRIFATVYRGRVATDARNAANAAAYAEWRLERTTPPHPLAVLEVLSPYAAVVVAGALLWPNVKYLLPLAAYAALLAHSTYARSRRREKLVAARDRNKAIAEALRGRPDVVFPAHDPNKPSPFGIRPGFAVGVALFIVVLVGAFALAAAKEHRPRGPSAAVRVLNAACDRKEDAYRRLRAAPPSIVGSADRAVVIEILLVKDVEASVPAARRSQTMNLMLGFENARIAALQNVADGFRSNDRHRAFAAASEAGYFADRFAGQASLLGVTTCA